MSDAIKHECGIALLRLKKPLEYYKEKYNVRSQMLHAHHVIFPDGKYIEAAPPSIFNKLGFGEL